MPMPMRQWVGRLGMLLGLLGGMLSANPSRAEEPLSTEAIVERCKPSVVVISSAGRDARQTGIGTGFVIDSKQGLIATNFHVIGEGRAFAVETADGKRHPIEAIHATDRKGDLAIIRISTRTLPELKLGKSTRLNDGQPIVALGNPQGLKFSVVEGVVSGRREIEGRTMIQLAMPVEPGNSGGPIVNRQGEVVGVVTLKSAITANLGFAMPSDALAALVAKPNPVTWDQWLALGAIDSTVWQPELGARWRQRVGRIWVEGAGTGFGGRAMCLRKSAPPKLPIELSVRVKLDDESGAAGLLFHADADLNHYGFYPTGGKLRLTRFDGPDVYAWNILADVPSPHYRVGEWNTLKVRLTREGMQCYVNDQLVITSRDTARTSGRIGLVKFRETAAEFRDFKVVSVTDGDATANAEQQDRVRKNLDRIPLSPPPMSDQLKPLVRDVPISTELLRERARQLEQQVAQLRALANRLHEERVIAELDQALSGDDAKVDLLAATLILSRLDQEEIDAAEYRSEVERLAAAVRRKLPKDASEATIRDTLRTVLFEEQGFHGSRDSFYSRANSSMASLLDDREGLPLTLAVLTMDLGQRLGLKFEGIGLPGYFVVRWVPKAGKAEYLDVYERGKSLTEAEIRDLIEANTGTEFDDEYLKPMAKKAIIVRMLRNLVRSSQEAKDADSALRYLEAIVRLEPDAHRERFLRSGMRLEKGRRAEAVADLEYLLEHASDEINVPRVLQLKEAIESGR
ncbi:transglutaminase family protein [Tuwongella immobilis]|uniref:Cyclic nucleotide-binding domain-containing protein n=1 Tax=Tuwongella immobilis TaxID=692036 RepID=A0A6C2YV56_9BACT|nr:transglutaminase family protein [Tuwongella immobilis]VIP04795.1 peptidase s1 and s6 chymotrypsin hap : Uncharacterized protein OS=Planctomyces maris DSM 8797 GN=PM8797T_30454 PE=4 SV=1: Trypsin_2: DUF1080: Transglut_core2: TPR_9 [Tuwongella immobilis]VTS06950.1 peptidase s1 and s6 chymotrypsin hap : Uncharacterized protein OS=Planctomyces maris DSM 8797 GN=PM8797T_30454 PE=4 SV=1: Trypsin_2: DUF1080: Transglut_core2: TPR_9 [Tuwongella immobilis]